MTDASAGSWQMPAVPSLPDLVAARVLEAIRTGELKPGERLVEITLAKRLGISRGPLREALKSLRAAHVVQGEKGHGMRVVDVSSQQVVNMLLVRGTLEGLAARIVAANRTAALLAPLIDLHAQSVVAAKAGRAAEWRDLDWRFHEAVCRAAGNEYLLSGWQSISNLVRVFLHRHPGFEHHTETVLHNHDALIGALLHCTPDEADARFRGGIIGSGFSRLGLPVPAYLESIVRQSGVHAMPMPAETPGA